MAAASHDDDEVVRVSGDRPWVLGEALAHDLARVDLDPRRTPRPAQLLDGDPRMLPQELADRWLGPAEPGHGPGDHSRDHQDPRRAPLVAAEPGHVGHAHEVGHAI